MFTKLFDKKTREDLKDKVDVAFAVFTIVTFAASRIKKRKESEAEEEKTE